MRNLLASPGQTTARRRISSHLLRHYVFFATAIVVIPAVAKAITPSGGTTLAWDPVSGDVSGYRLYIGTQSSNYSQVADAGNATQLTLTNLNNGATYFFSVTAYSSQGVESAYAPEISYQVGSEMNPPPTITMTSPANGSVFIEPADINCAASVTTNGHAISKVMFYNGSTFLGQTASQPFVFTWTNVSIGNYSLSAEVWYDGSVAVSSPAVSVTVTSGRPPPNGPTLTLTQISGGVPTIQGAGAAASHVYDAQESSDFLIWTSLGNVTADTSGSFAFSDSSAVGVTIRFYRVQDITSQ